MPPKAGRKRARESTGTAGSKATAGTASSSAPGSAPPASRRTRSNSATSQQEEDGGVGNAGRATKRTRRGAASDRDTDSNEDVDMGESDGPPVANGSGARAAAGGVAARKGGRRKSTSAVEANGEVCVTHYRAQHRGSSSSGAGGCCCLMKNNSSARDAYDRLQQHSTTLAFRLAGRDGDKAIDSLFRAFDPSFGAPTATAAWHRVWVRMRASPGHYQRCLLVGCLPCQGGRMSTSPVRTVSLKSSVYPPPVLEPEGPSSSLPGRAGGVPLSRRNSSHVRKQRCGNVV